MVEMKDPEDHDEEREARDSGHVPSCGGKVTRIGA